MDWMGKCVLGTCQDPELCEHSTTLEEVMLSFGVCRLDT